MRGGKTREVPAFPEIEETVGYNPARFLDIPIDESSSIGATSPFATTWAVIQGLMKVETIRHWCNVEAALGRGRNGGPRKRVIKRLNERKIQIENGATDHEPAVEDIDSPPVSLSESENSTIADGETASDDAVAEPTPTAATTTSAATVATDGGESPPTPRCPESNCRAELTPEEVDDGTKFWCSYCGGFKEPIDEADTVEATA